MFTEVNRIVNKGLIWYEKYFDMPYPFEKYDGVYCPEFHYGAMENPGLISYTEGHLHA